VPIEEPVVFRVAVKIEEPRGDDQPSRVDLSGAPSRHGADRDDRVVAYGEVPRHAGSAIAVDDGPAPEDEIVTGPTASEGDDRNLLRKAWDGITGLF